MSARQAFIPSSESQPHLTERDEDRDMFVNGNGKARSITAFFGQRRGGDTGSQGPRQNQGSGLLRPNSCAPRRSFDGLLRPEMTPMSIVPYPATTQQLVGPGVKQSVSGHTPRKTAAQGAFEFAKPMTPVSLPRGPKKSFGPLAENLEGEAIQNGDAHGNGTVFTGSGDEADVRGGAWTRTGGYMRAFETSEGGRGVGGIYPSLEHDIAAPAPVSMLGLGANIEDGGCEAFAFSSRPSDVPNVTKVYMERNDDSQRGVGSKKRGTRPEDAEENGWYTGEAQEYSKRLKQVHHDSDEYIPISSPHIPQTPAPPSSSIDVPDPSLLASKLFENLGEYVNIEQIEADWKRWEECSTEEWLKGADKLAQDYADILNMVKDHLTEQVMAYAGMVSSIEERQAKVKRNIDMINDKGNIVRENISRLGTKK